ncbi:MAG: apolipoprotein N-acyltransferase [Myxococcota bacterium]
MSARGRALCLAGFALALFAAFPHPVGGRVVDLGWLVAWLVPGLLIAGLEGLAPGRAARDALLASLAGHGLVLHWIFVVTVSYGHAPAAVGVLAPLLLCLYIAGSATAFGAAWSLLRRAGLGGPWAAAALWTAMDHARSFVLTGFPWATLGYAQHENAALLGFVQWTGVYGLSFVTALGSAAVVEALLARRAGRPVPVSVWSAAAAVGILQVAGAWTPDPSPGPDAPRIRVAALQGNIDQGNKWSREWAGRTLGIYEELARTAAGAGAQVIVWPETAVPGALDVDPQMRLRIEKLALETGAVHVVGSVGIESDGGGGYRYFDSAFVLATTGEVVTRYDKSHLVPFGEYIPLRDWLGRFVSAVARGIASADVTAGAAPRALELSVPGRGGSAASAVKVGVPICYELLFPDLVRRFVKDGGRVLFGITNDAWYGRTGAPHQFLAITALRSAETGAWTVRAANTGVSAVIDGRGRVRERTAIFERGLIVSDVPLRPDPAPETFYTRHGDVFAWTCWAATALALAGAWRRRPEQARETES